MVRTNKNIINKKELSEEKTEKKYWTSKSHKNQIFHSKIIKNSIQNDYKLKDFSNLSV